MLIPVPSLYLLVGLPALLTSCLSKGRESASMADTSDDNAAPQRAQPISCTSVPSSGTRLALLQATSAASPAGIGRSKVKAGTAEAASAAADALECDRSSAPCKTALYVRLHGSADPCGDEMSCSLPSAVAEATPQCASG